MNEILHIYHTNDIHSHFENWPKIRHFLQRKKEQHARNNEEMLLFDLGDHVDRCHPYTEGTMGKANVRLLNELGYLAATIGNNEGITMPHDALDTLYQEAQFDIILANLYDDNFKRPKWTVPRKIYTTKGGVRIGVTGVTAPFYKLYRLLGWQISNPLKELETQIDFLKKQADIIVVLSHLGIHEDLIVAKLYPEVDLILGGHTHHVLEKGETDGQTLLAAAGKYGYYLGHVKLEIDPGAKKIVHRSARALPTGNFQEPHDEASEIEHYYFEGKKLLDKKLVYLPETLESDWFRDNCLAGLLCEAVMEWCGADCAFLNAGLVLGSLEQGPVTKFDLHRILPHPINPCLIELTGAQLQEVLLATLDPKWPHLELKGLGFRGKIMGQFVYRRIQFNHALRKIYINGQPVAPDRIYKLGTIDMYTFGNFFPHIREAKIHYFMPEFLRDVLEWKLVELYKVRP
ncbi:putative metallophosphoesterase YunD [Weizmannia acidilactici]|uniref:bifunctional metallophosphatase/5'-nucleotidase n=1 Tax=Weizmannia acidilactici TaxID=2607726 RepID=UPI00124EFC61|nr:bifunctional UDP-sugar hydrolase/5'-nucleotidase [Weizmannia acidilactici]GER68204.1 putative metallophosphoesterase YunD [Weizmannia acidilactici]